MSPNNAMVHAHEISTQWVLHCDTARQVHAGHDSGDAVSESPGEFKGGVLDQIADSFQAY